MTETAAQNPEKNRAGIEVEVGLNLGVVVPTVGRPSLSDTLASVATQVLPRDRVIVVCDRPKNYNLVQYAVEAARQIAVKGSIWRCVPARPLNENRALGRFGHPARNLGIDLAGILDMAPEWCWTLDDDDVATFGAIAAIRQACASGLGPWYVFRMRGGAGSHFAGVTVPTMGEAIQKGNIGTPMMVFPTKIRPRFGIAPVDGHEDGYFGDYEMAMALERELGAPHWCEEVVCEVRPGAGT